MLTTAFTTYLTRPVSSGVMQATGRVVYRSRSQYISEAILHDSEANEIGRGSGIFVRGKTKLSDAMGYDSAQQRPAGTTALTGLSRRLQSHRRARRSKPARYPALMATPPQ